MSKNMHKRNVHQRLLRFQRRSLWLALLLLFGGCAVIPARLLWPAKEMSPHDGEVIFSHARHIKMTIECTVCHPDAPVSQKVQNDLLPDKPECMQCHKQTQQCRLCHLNVEKAVDLQPRTYSFLTFSHAQHATEIDCTGCHSGITRSERVSDVFYPSATTCRQCHEINEDTCQKCHANLGDAMLPISHDTDWLQRHENQAADAGFLCEQCHRGSLREGVVEAPEGHDRATMERSDVSTFDVSARNSQFATACADCHRGDIWPASVHDNNYIQSHSIDARTSTTTCISCHVYEECQACHTDQSFAFLDVHPQGWQFDHADAARRELSACVTCHVEADCQGCHQTLSPHPKDWDVEMHAGNEKVCKKCHFGDLELTK